MQTNLNYSANHQPFMKLEPLKTKKTLKRNLFTYQFLATIQTIKARKNPKYEKPFYQLNLICHNEPTINKIFVIYSKLTNLLI